MNSFIVPRTRFPLVDAQKIPCCRRLASLTECTEMRTNVAFGAFRTQIQPNFVGLRDQGLYYNNVFFLRYP